MWLSFSIGEGAAYQLRSAYWLLEAIYPCAYRVHYLLRFRFQEFGLPLFKLDDLVYPYRDFYTVISGFDVPNMRQPRY